MNTCEQSMGIDLSQLPPGTELEDGGVWCQVLNRVQDRHPRPTLFLDRDGVIVEEVNYLSRPDDVQLIDGAAQVIAAANARGVPVVIVTNQAGIGYGKFEWRDFIDVQEKIINELDHQGAYVNCVFACPFHEKARPPYQQHEHRCRKPNPGMLEKAERHISILKPSSWIIGDRANDLEAGFRFGLGNGIHVQTGHGSNLQEQDAARSLTTSNFQVTSIPSIADIFSLAEFFK